ncbi:hypothetical protein [Mycolicibacterium bacteremicum]|uniref:hypothetical protein n=1 Tax=Mycolicibacterium bacteremicum TaxID=564198 RepID=UPI0026EBFDDD|nr:hypothetical protein [Mycolicibacterium bacteremicum]
MTTPDNDVPAIITTPDRVCALVGTLDGAGLYLGLRFECLPPLGTIEIRLGHEAATSIATDLTRLLNLDNAQRAALLDSLIPREQQ